jgi:hypothetical protein
MPVRFVFCGAELLYLFLSIRCFHTHPVRIHPLIHLVFPPPDSLQLHRLQGFWHVLLQSVKSVITIVTKVFLDGTPVKLNEVQLTVKLWQKDTQMTSSFNYFLHDVFNPYQLMTA